VLCTQALQFIRAALRVFEIFIYVHGFVI